ncbi:hypothetical protein FACS189440_22090 [Bacteroidia bacterium]|nr:hypothetical protein FACS189440_22090 [Bacteroidia bacterium]
MNPTNNHINNYLETSYTNSVSSEHRKKFAQFFTPIAVAEMMIKWLLGNENLKTVLEPAFGLGIFQERCFRKKTIFK